MTHYDRDPAVEGRPEEGTVIELTPDERRLLVAIDIMPNNKLHAIVMAIDMLILPEMRDTTNRESKVRIVRDKLEYFTEAVQRIENALPEFEHHPNPELRALFQPLTQSLELIRLAKEKTREVAEVMNTHIDAELSESSPAVQRLARLQDEIDDITKQFQPYVQIIGQNPAYMAYRKGDEADRGTMNV